MNIRSLILGLVLGLPAAGLLFFGPRGRPDVPRDRTIIRYWEKWTGVEGAAMQRIVDHFNATVGAERGLWVDYQALGDVDKRMLIATAGGDPPDVAGLPDRFVPAYADQGALRPLDDLAREFDLDLTPPQFSLTRCRLKLDVGFGLACTDRHVRRDIQFLTELLKGQWFCLWTPDPQPHEEH